MPPQEETSAQGVGLRQRKAAAAATAAAVATTTTTTTGEVDGYSWEDVAKHNTAQSCWVSASGKVYDITAWLDSHPGGSEILLLVAGRDITDAFESYHPFSAKPAQILKKFEIGVLKSHEYPPYAPDTGFYKTLRSRLDAYFKENKIDPQDPVPGTWRMAMVLLIGVSAFYGAYGPLTTPFGFGFRCLCSLIFGITQALPLLHVMHDCSHCAFSHSPTWWAIAGRFFFDFYAGGSMTSWHNQHTIGHHIFTNVYLCDPDLPCTESGDIRRLVSRQKYSSVYRWQWLYLPPVYGFLGLKARVDDFVETFYREKSGPLRVNSLRPLQVAELLISKFVWALWRFGIPFGLWGNPTGSLLAFWTLFFVGEFVTGYHLAFNFQVSHVSVHCDYPSGKVATPALPDEWAISQVKSSVDYSHGNWLTTFMCGALNYQVTHHLFPTISQYHYPAIAPIIQQVCEQYKVKYTVLPNFYTALVGHIQHLYNLGLEEQPAPFHMG